MNKEASNFLNENMISQVINARFNRRVGLLGAIGLGGGLAMRPMLAFGQELVIDRPPHGSPILKFDEASKDQWFIPKSSANNESWSFYAELQAPSYPQTVITDDGTTLHQLFLDGPTREVGFNARFNEAFQKQILGEGVQRQARTAIWFDGIAKDSRILVLDEQDRVKDVIDLEGNNFAGLLLPDGDFTAKIRVIRPKDSPGILKAVIGSLSNEDAVKNLPHTVKDLAKSFGLSASVYPEILPKPTIASPEPVQDLPRFKFQDVSSRPELYGRWFLAQDEKGNAWNNALSFRLPHQLPGVFYRSMDGIGRIGISTRNQAPVFDIDMQVNPLFIENYALVDGKKVIGSEPGIYIKTQPGSEIVLLDKDRQEQFTKEGGKVRALADTQGDALMILPKELVELRLRVKLADKRLDWDNQLNFGPKPPTYNPNGEYVLRADSWGIKV